MKNKLIEESKNYYIIKYQGGIKYICRICNPRDKKLLLKEIPYKSFDKESNLNQHIIQKHHTFKDLK